MGTNNEDREKNDRCQTGSEVFPKFVLVYDFSFESFDAAHVFRCFVQELIGMLKVQVFFGNLLERN